MNTTNVPTKPAGNDGATGADKLVDLKNPTKPDSAATVRDLQNMGWVISATDNGYTDTVKNANKVEFNGEGVEVTGKTVGDVRQITTKVKVDGTTTKIDPTGNVTVATGGLSNNPDGTVRADETNGTIATVGDVANAINNSGWDLDASVENGTNGEVINDPAPARVKPGSKVQVKAGQNIVVKRSGSDVTVSTSKNPTFDTVQVGGNNGPKVGSDREGNVRVAKADGTPSKITNVARGT